ncbi:GNAT family N-acetyltransferase [Nocardia transvalensis]|uniref:GNAT family N-acetyltransferase n=1 Tax=Nocardia transvalensis TaxID=37333 RepID=UPI001893D8A5|nr:GNAT family N-acetyltransferase [Nocardia transvalensis]MBF6332963.1 GNAT family N-acetyltransferase [Nocardia transvalensis]
MVRARQAVAADAAELVRLRAVMIEALDGRIGNEHGWREHAAQTLRKRLADPDGSMAAFVVDRPGEPGALAACAVGVVEHLLSSPSNPSGTLGYLFNVATEQAHRRRGYSRACVVALLDWFRRREVGVVDLHASQHGAPLYTALGFRPTADPSMRLRLR